ncbi:T9SS type A sorting domain-containing protein [Pontibacter sp. HSC-14F20]|uniref:T9SS type A sorting domain-containing protein n=1 Tax=Pontibacter sp. HSC-14F20 TaxID=2864136 RepID=UPI001C72B701|nr:T9SS type A sorting domain-containing protein [Pontibacter sp. HSC-14F20]MBX0332584.1 T9SS type A sorting domain-containing protein [Pontibacter sp. HSC-14F20]
MKSLFLLLLSLLSLQAAAQQEAVNWYFGNRAGLDFSSGQAAPLPGGALITESASAVMSDRETGQLLFYTNGRNFWNREHRLMPGSDEFPPECPSAISQPSLIVPVPGDAHRFYVFSIRFSQPADRYNCSFGYIVDSIEPAYSCELRYSLVDMRLDGGRGGVVAEGKNTLLRQGLTEKLTAIPHSNGRDYWLLVHAWDSDAFLVFPISAVGVGEPVTQRIGSAHQRRMAGDRVDNSEIRGMMKASPDGRKLGCAVSAKLERPFDLFDFDPESGVLSNYLSLGNLEAQYGVSFSPDNTKLYVSCLSPAGATAKDIIRQYDLAAGSPEAVIASGQSIIRGNRNTDIPSTELGTGYFDLQLGPDGRLYGTSHHVYDKQDSREGRTVLVIGKPNEPGYSCEVSLREFNFGGGNVALGLPNFIQSYFKGLEPGEREPGDCDPAIALYPNPTPDAVRLRVGGACPQQFEVQVINAVGQRLVNRFPLESPGVAELSLAGLADGLYLFVLTSPQGRIVKRVIKVQALN